MKKPIDFDDLFNRVSDNREFAKLMLETFFNSMDERLSLMDQQLENEEYDALADSAHQLKGILGNLAIHKGFDLLKLIHSNAKMKKGVNAAKNINLLKNELEKANKFYVKSQDLFPDSEE